MIRSLAITSSLLALSPSLPAAPRPRPRAASARARSCSPPAAASASSPSRRSRRTPRPAATASTAAGPPPAAASRSSSQRDFGLDLIERDRHRDHRRPLHRRHPPLRGRRQRVAHRRHLGRAASMSPSATPSRATRSSSGDFSGVEDAVFFHNGGIAYTCWKQPRIVDARATASSSPSGARSRNSRSRRTRTASASASTTPSRHDAEDARRSRSAPPPACGGAASRAGRRAGASRRPRGG